MGTRLDKARGEEYDGVVLAAAGLLRLGRRHEISEYLPPEVCTPEMGQGALGVEVRASDSKSMAMLLEIDHGPTNAAVTSERSFLKTIGGGCKVPVAAHARLEGGQLHISAMAALPDGSRVYRAEVTHKASDPVLAGRSAAQALMETGAREIVTGDAGR